MVRPPSSLKKDENLSETEKEVMYKADRAIKRAEELVEKIQTVLIPNASHMLTFEQAELVNSNILIFLSGDK